MTAPPAAPLLEADVSADAIDQFRRWFDEARGAVPDPTAMSLASASADGAPSCRIVLLKQVDADGFRFYTNYESRKGRELDGNPRAALVFHWAQLERQVRVEGHVRRASAADSDAYFASRPRESQLGAWASAQSRPVDGRAPLDERFHAEEARFAGRPVERPPHWGGYLLAPGVIEFWQARPGRFHDRLRYTREAPQGWRIERLCP